MKAQLRRAHGAPRAQLRARAPSPTVASATAQTAVAEVPRSPFDAGAPTARTSSGIRVRGRVRTMFEGMSDAEAYRYVQAAQKEKATSSAASAAAPEDQAPAAASAAPPPKKRPPPLPPPAPPPRQLPSEPQSRGSAEFSEEPQLRGSAEPPRKRQRTWGINYVGEATTWNHGLTRTEDGKRVPSTLAMAVNVAVVTPEATKQDVFACVDAQKAGVFIVVWDPEVLRPRQEPASADPAPLRETFHGAVLDAITVKNDAANSTEEPYWRMAELFDKTGLVLWRPHFVAEAAVAESVVGATHAVTILRFRLQLSERNPAAVLGFAVMTRHAVPDPPQPKITQAEQTHWEESFVREAVATIHSQSVRFLCGLFDVAPEQFSDLCRSCGASYKCPIGVPFRAWPALFGGVKSGTRVMHPNYMVPIGPSDVRIADYQFDSAGKPTDEEPPWLPDWMLRTCQSLIVRRWVTTKCMPRWEEDHDRSSGIRRRLGLQALLPIGKIVQKMLYPKTFEAHWRAGVHQNIIFLGHGRQSQNSKRRWEKDNARW